MPSRLTPLAPGIGRPPKHAGRLLARVLRKNRLDRRTRVSKILDHVATDLAADFGGWPCVSASQEIAIRRAAFLTVLCSSIEAWCLRQPDVIVDGELLGPLKKGLATHQANLIRTLAALGIRPRAERVPSLQEYLASRHNAGQGDDPGTGQPTPSTEAGTAPTAASEEQP